MIVKIKRACKEGEYNINGCKYEIDSLRLSLNNYKNKIYIYNKEDIIGDLIAYDKDSIYIDINNFHKFKEIKEPIALFTLSCEILDRIYMIYKINEITKIEIADNKKLNIL